MIMKSKGPTPGRRTTIVEVNQEMHKPRLTESVRSAMRDQPRTFLKRLPVREKRASPVTTTGTVSVVKNYVEQ
jgi:hypothetical protein